MSEKTKAGSPPLPSLKDAGISSSLEPELVVSTAVEEECDTELAKDKSKDGAYVQLGEIWALTEETVSDSDDSSRSSVEEKASEVASSGDVFDEFHSHMGRLPQSPLELVDFSEEFKRIDTMDIEEATDVYRKKAVGDSLMLGSPPLRSHIREESEDELADYFSAMQQSAIRKHPFLSKHQSASTDYCTLNKMLSKMSSEAESSGAMKSLGFRELLKDFIDEDYDDESSLCSDSDFDSEDELGITLTPAIESEADETLGQSGKIAFAKTLASLSASASVSVEEVDSKKMKVEPLKKGHLPLDAFILKKCTDQTASGKAYGEGLLFFIERLAESKLAVLAAIAEAVDKTDNAVTKTALVNLVRIWYAQYPQDFEESTEMKRMRAEVVSKFPATESSSLASFAVTLTTDKMLKPLQSADRKLKDARTGEWISIAKRKKRESLPATYLCTNDKLIVKHKKHTEAGPKKKRKLSALTRGRELVARKLRKSGKSLLDEMPTIRWLDQMPIWALATAKITTTTEPKTAASGYVAVSTPALLDSCSAPKKMPAQVIKSASTKPLLQSKTSITMEDLEIGSERVSSSKLEDDWDSKWPHLTLYFAHGFPPNLMSVELSPRDVAEAWTALKLRILRRIKPREFANRGWTSGKPKEMSPNIRHMIEQFEAEAKWARMVLIEENNTDARGFKMKRLLKIALECVELGNLDTACAIRAGMFRRSVLALPMKELSAKYLLKLQQLTDLDDSRHRNVKQLASERLAAGRPVLPLLVVHLDKLYRIEEAWKPVDESGIVHMRWVKGMQDTVSEVLKSQRCDFSLTDKRDIQLLLIGEIKRHCAMTEEQIEREAEVALAAFEPEPRRSRKASFTMRDYVFGV